MKVTDMGEVFNNVTVIYPRINRTYRFDSVENRTVPCDPMEDGAAYELSFMVGKDEARELHKRCMELFKKAAESDPKGRKWPDKPTYLPYKEGPDGDVFTIKAKLKGAYGADKTRPPVQKDAQRKDLPEDFMLTSNSKCNVWGVLFAYNTGAVSGVSYRLKGVQVLELAAMQSSGDPFGETEGYTGESSSGDPFGLPSAAPSPAPAAASSEFDDQIPF